MQGPGEQRTWRNLSRRQKRHETGREPEVIGSPKCRIWLQTGCFTRNLPAMTFPLSKLTGFAFVAALAGFAWWCLFGGGKSRRELRPLAFGAIWFLVASIPTSWIPLAEVENDHRMYFPFVGMALAVCQGGALFWRKRPHAARVLVPACAVLLALFAWGTRERNRVWHRDRLNR